jgi:hypothetical protein
MRMMKGDDFTLSRDIFVASASMMYEPAAESHGRRVSWVVCHFLGGKGISDHC